MTETSTPSIPSIPSTPAVIAPTEVKAPSSAKPYDDELLDAYEAEALAETKSETSNEETKVEVAKSEDDTKSDQTEAKSKEGDKIDDGFESVPIKRTINGKEVEFKVKDAIQAFVKQEEFNRNMDKRITHVSQREKAWQTDQSQFKEKVNEVIKVAQGGDFVTAIKALAKVAVGSSGLDVTEFEKQYFEQLDKIRDVYTKLTPEQREAYFAKRALKEAQERTKTLEGEKTAQAEKGQLEQSIKTLVDSNGLNEDEFWSNYGALKQLQVGQGKHFKTSDDIKAEDVVQYSLRVRHEEKVIEAGKKLGLDDDSILSEVSRVTSIDPTLTVDDIAKVIESSGLAKNAKPAAVENLNRKAGKSNTRFNQASSTKKENGKIEGLDKEDLDFLYRKQPRGYTRIVR